MTARLSNYHVASPEDRQIQQQLEDVEARLVARYGQQPTVSEEYVRTTVEREAERFSHARVRTYVPILVERAARHDLDTRAAGH
ncbi:MAG: hypothetical protein QOC67_4311 [Pseudonocardiales bacterium]|jgi:hypothetical protein|uniref:three-helix bundle dimerization domain-containing protein n=1 Tax=Pseudonocardia sp. Cha107L01 TaxID=3457576 RepID=UPI0028C677BD|nr:hypothetical protein [Pseudonocardiales bacterium]MDT7643107.1 hypothetical protein [Pseudonocardiales bacterium]MDT7775387.1 hypothetical protein [Pseudonocardiales bacterium]